MFCDEQKSIDGCLLNVAAKRPSRKLAENLFCIDAPFCGVRWRFIARKKTLVIRWMDKFCCAFGTFYANGVDFEASKSGFTRCVGFGNFIGWYWREFERKFMFARSKVFRVFILMKFVFIPAVFVGAAILSVDAKYDGVSRGVKFKRTVQLDRKSVV